MVEDDEDAFFREGVELFNAGEWFEAHEVWEDAWRLAEGPRKRFYQGLIQCAVTLEHARRGNPRGVRSVIKTALPKFDGLPDVYRGVHVSKLLSELLACVQPILDLPAEAFDPALPRGRELPFDPAKAPKIVLAG
jgi:uncharacterized protein